MAITQATEKDIPELVALLNSAYRGEDSKKGWTHEAHLVEGDLRTDAAHVIELMESPGAFFLKYLNERGKLEGCVFLQKKGSKLYLGMLSVSPLTQAKGIGKQLMSAAEDHARAQSCEHIFMKVISLRHELIAWYERKGFQGTGQTEPFPTDTKFGIPTQQLEFIILEKKI
jgi:ribosomal protein S18 acetylase RimI-like enzyme